MYIRNFRIARFDSGVCPTGFHCQQHREDVLSPSLYHPPSSPQRFPKYLTHSHTNHTPFAFPSSTCPISSVIFRNSNSNLAPEKYENHLIGVFSYTKSAYSWSLSQHPARGHSSSSSSTSFLPLKSPFPAPRNQMSELSREP